MAVYDPKFDLNKDGKIDALDFNILKQYYNLPVDYSDLLSVACDFNGDGYITALDYSLFHEHYGAFLEPKFAKLQIKEYSRIGG